MAILSNSNAISSGGYPINNSLRFRSSASAYLNRTPASAGNRQKWTLSTWVKRGALGSLQVFFSADASANTEAADFDAYFGASDTLQIGYGSANWKETSQVFRDPSAWYHIVIAFDTTLATGTDRIKLYVNGSQVTAFAANTAPTLNLNGAVNNTVGHSIGRRNNATFYSDNYQTEVNFIDGQALTPSSFGETDTTTGVWKPKAYSGTYGTNGFYLKFSDIATTSGSNAGLGKDFSSNSNYWTTNNISVTAGTTYDAMTDSPTNTSATVANYAVLNPLLSTSYQTLSNANLTSTNNTSADNGNTYSSIPTGFSGKWYCEFKTINASSGYPTVGTRDVAITTRPINGAYGSIGGDPIGGSSGSVGYRANGDKSINGNATAYGSSYTDSDTIGIAVDADNGAIYFSKNGTWQNSGDPTSGATKTGAANTWTGGSQSFYIGASIYPSGNGVHFNFGQRPFTYTPPTGYVALNTFNLPTPTILQGNKYMDATLYTGNGSTQTITNAGSFRPDLVWGKCRNSAQSHGIQDSVRGATLQLTSNSTAAEITASGQVTTFNSNGFSLGNDASGYSLNTNGNTYVGWQWQAGQGTTSSNTSGSITSTVSVNTTAGFSIVTYTGTGANATVGHGLGVAPKMVIVKRRDNGIGATNWWVYHVGLNAGVNPQQWGISLNQTAAQVGLTARWNDTAPTSSVFSLGTNNEVNGSGGTFVAYVFSEIAGFSRFGSYTGNGSADGPFVFTNLKPKFIMIKRTDTIGNWRNHDTSRDTYNVAQASLYPNLSNAEGTGSNEYWDLLSNGFKLRTTDSEQNANGGTYIYMAFAENPFKNSLAR